MASIGVVDVMKPFRSHSRTRYPESTVFTFWVADPMVAMLFRMVSGENLKCFKKIKVVTKYHRRQENACPSCTMVVISVAYNTKKS